MKSSQEIRTVVLGDEYDDDLRDALRETLVALGATGKVTTWGVGGSQELETLETWVEGVKVTVEAETYVGLSIATEAHLAERIQMLVRAGLPRGRIKT